MLILEVILAIVVIIAFFLIGVYNSLSVARQKIKEGFSDIDTMLKKRYDLVPNLVETVKGYAKHEKELFEKIAEARAASIGNGSMEEKAKASNELSGALKTLFAVAEAYPELKANQNFMDLQSQLSEIETDIQNSRRYFNGAVKEYNSTLVVFPNNIVAGMFGFREEKYFEAAEAEKENVKVQF